MHENSTVVYYPGLLSISRGLLSKKTSAFTAHKYMGVLHNSFVNSFLFFDIGFSSNHIKPIAAIVNMNIQYQSSRPHSLTDAGMTSVCVSRIKSVSYDPFGAQRYSAPCCVSPVYFMALI
jgi:hypothetical protein